MISHLDNDLGAIIFLKVQWNKVTIGQRVGSNLLIRLAEE